MKFDIDWKLITSNLVTLVVAFLVFKGTEATSDASVLNSLVNRVEVLEETNRELQDQIISLSFEKMELKSKLMENVTRLDFMQNFVDSLPFPAWIKSKDSNGKFRMLMINNAYSYRYGISKSKYQGSYDEEVWDKEIASGFAIADNKVYESKSFVLTEELIPESGPGSKRRLFKVWKFVIKVGPEAIGVGGLVVMETDYVYKIKK